jgi:hypothetical protein
LRPFGIFHCQLIHMLFGHFGMLSGLMGRKKGPPFFQMLSRCRFEWFKWGPRYVLRVAA